ncbi:MAG: hypothetical protein MN733_03425 [Nitrososphaera sp.]|nr:hypothetical protein [Nitrososphaera sp.]
MTQMTNEQKRQKVMTEICLAIVDTINEAGPMGVPSGYLYAALMGVMSLDTFERIMAVLVQGGEIEKRGLCYHPKRSN